MKKSVVKVLMVLLTLLLLTASAAMAVCAIDWDGTATGTGGASGVPASGGYSVHGNLDLRYMLAGYRFSYAQYNGSSWEVQGNTGMDNQRCIEVWLTASQTYLGTSTIVRGVVLYVHRFIVAPKGWFFRGTSPFLQIHISMAGFIWYTFFWFSFSRRSCAASPNLWKWTTSRSRRNLMALFTSGSSERRRILS